MIRSLANRIFQPRSPSPRSSSPMQPRSSSPVRRKDVPAVPAWRAWCKAVFRAGYACSVNVFVSFGMFRSSYSVASLVVKQIVPGWSNAGLALYWFLLDTTSLIFCLAFIVTLVTFSYVCHLLKMLHGHYRDVQKRSPRLPPTAPPYVGIYLWLRNQND